MRSERSVTTSTPAGGPDGRRSLRLRGPRGGAPATPDPGDTDPATPDPADTDPATPDPADTTPGATDPADTTPGATSPGPTGPDTGDPDGTPPNDTGSPLDGTGGPPAPESAATPPEDRARGRRPRRLRIRRPTTADLLSGLQLAFLAGYAATAQLPGTTGLRGGLFTAVVAATTVSCGLA
ncbi:MAG TPA: hypothetical protein VFP72_06885, partial [Kineosporiaceae bacterium]|nr:hypothetical protein [Kineosporiaceae bacterium]